MSADTSILPSELLVTPLPLVGFTGLDAVRNPVHKMIWESFSNNRKNDRAQIQFKLLPPNYEFPVSKPKRQSYEWYHPKGILKKNWMLKHLHVLPAVVVLFQDIEWNDPMWSEKQLHCASLVQTLKNSLEGQNTKICIALLQRNPPAPPSENLVSAERTANLASACDINPKLIVVMNYQEHLLGYTYRLEASFLELAQSYYTQMAKQIRLHRDQLTDSTHLVLQIRHQFKLGIIAEIRLDHPAALKSYSQAYSTLGEIRVVDSNCLEIKTIAGFLNYKICKLMFRSVPRDAIAHFKAHIDRFRGRTGFKELIFEHYAWMGLQYNAFAEMFCDAIKMGLPALQTQHPGIYYHKAAEYIGQRKDAFLECRAANAATNTFPIDQSNANASYNNQFYSEFFGVRTTKIGDASTEQQLFALVQANEANFNHSAAIISLLGQAMFQYKMYKCLRFRKKLAVDMAEEYLKSGDHSKALTLYSLMLTDYRIDKWYSVFSQVLLKTLQSAYLTGSVVDFLTCSVEALSPTITISQMQRTAIIDNFWKVLQHNVPTQPDDETAESKSKPFWEASLSKFHTPVIIDLDKLSVLFDSIVTFDQPQVKHDERLQLKLFIRSQSEIPIQINQVTIVLADSSANYKINSKWYLHITGRDLINETSSASSGALESSHQIFIDSNGLVLQPDTWYKFVFTADDFNFTENEELSILRLEMDMGTDKHHVTLLQSNTLNIARTFKSHSPRMGLLDNIVVYSSCYIVPTFHLSTLNDLYDQPMLTNEYFKAACVISNTFNVALQNVGVCITVPAIFKNKVFITADLTKGTQKLLSTLQFDIGDLQMQTTHKIQYFVVSLCEGNIELSQKVWYTVDNIPMSNVPTNIVVESPVHKSTASAPNQQPQPTHLSSSGNKHNNKTNQTNLNIEYLPNGGGVRKFREDVVIIPCVEEFSVRGCFYTLNKKSLTRALRDEDFLMRVDLEVKASCSLDILDMFFICDQNISEKPYLKQRKKYEMECTKGAKIRDIKMLRAQCTTAQWLRSADVRPSNDSKTIAWNRRGSSAARVSLIDQPVIAAASTSRKEDKFKTNLLSKLPMNSTIIGSTNTMSSSLMNRSSSDLEKVIQPKIEVGALTTSITQQSSGENDITSNATNSSRMLVKNIYNKALDAFVLSDHCKGFLKENSIADSSGMNWPVFGVYCVRWRRCGSNVENESKFVIQGIEVLEPPLNLYCYLDDRMYVKVPMTLTITLQNPNRSSIHLKTTLKNSDHFMFSGNSQLNISIFALSTFELSFNLYPLKAGWQNLPEFEITYNTQYESSATPAGPTSQVNNSKATAPIPNVVVDGQLKDVHNNNSEANTELQQLVNRWMPKKVFILPMLRHIQ